MSKQEKKTKKKQILFGLEVTEHYVSFPLSKWAAWERPTVPIWNEKSHSP